MSDLERRLGPILLGGLALAGLWAVAPFSLPGFERFHLTKEVLSLALTVPVL